MNNYYGVNMKKMGQKTKFRVTFLSIVFIISIVVFSSTAVSYFSQIIRNNKELEILRNEYNNKLAEESILKDEINKLQDPEYLAKYAREKFLYSKKGEIIIKIEK